MAQEPRDRHHPGQGPIQHSEDRPAGPVPMKHRNRLGQNVVDNPQGNGRPSTDLKIGNDARKTW